MPGSSTAALPPRPASGASFLPSPGASLPPTQEEPLPDLSEVDARGRASSPRQKLSPRSLIGASSIVGFGPAHSATASYEQDRRFWVGRLEASKGRLGAIRHRHLAKEKERGSYSPAREFQRAPPVAAQHASAAAAAAEAAYIALTSAHAATDAAAALPPRPRPRTANCGEPVPWLSTAGITPSPLTNKASGTITPASIASRPNSRGIVPPSAACSSYGVAPPRASAPLPSIPPATATPGKSPSGKAARFEEDAGNLLVPAPALLVSARATSESPPKPSAQAAVSKASTSADVDTAADAAVDDEVTTPRSAVVHASVLNLDGQVAALVEAAELGVRRVGTLLEGAA